MKHKGFAQIFLAFFVAFLLFIVGMAVLPTLGDQVDIAFSNTTLFPAAGAASVVGKLVPLFFVVAIIVAGVGLIIYSGRGEG